MPKTIKEERLRWILPIFNKEIRLKDVAKVCPHGKRSLERWLAAYRKYGETGLVPKSTRPKSNPRETPIRIKVTWKLSFQVMETGDLETEFPNFNECSVIVKILMVK